MSLLQLLERLKLTVRRPLRQNADPWMWTRRLSDKLMRPLYDQIQMLDSFNAGSSYVDFVNLTKIPRTLPVREVLGPKGFILPMRQQSTS